MTAASMTATIDTGLTKTGRTDASRELSKAPQYSFARYLKPAADDGDDVSVDLITPAIGGA